jgi:cysteine-rich repeat protein
MSVRYTCSVHRGSSLFAAVVCLWFSACGDNRAPVCGDGVKQGHEECDDGNLEDDDACPSTCQRWRCGDAFVRRDVEDCDDGAANSDTTPDACRADCRAARCGDGVLDSNEGCEDGNANNNDACLNNCISATCGDGLVQANVEECDDGAGNSSITPDACRPYCRKAHCGDSVRDTGEGCDDADDDETDYCLSTCVAATCGDGVVHLGFEECDDAGANSDTAPDGCRADCSLHRCGDTVVDSDEGCDDGNSANNDNCPTTCEPATCGDGFVYTGVEACDDANASNSDFCAGCSVAFCGDGFVFEDVEPCDEGAGNSATAPDTCRPGCQTPRCGDGVVDTGELCDVAGNATSSCDIDCTLPSCGDGQTNVAFGETCDDANAIAGDGCTPTCVIEPGYIIYVNASATGAGNGTSWADAFPSLQDALRSTTQGEIWVARGTYYPDQGTGIDADDAFASFVLRSDVAVYGGFAGLEVARVQRNVVANATILSGYIAGVVRSRHVVRANNVTGARLDGFRVEWGRNSYGGPALTASGSSLTIANCVIATNGTQDSITMQDVTGGAIYAEDSAVTIERSRISQNVAAVDSNVTQLKAQGGAIYARGGVLTIRNSELADNSTFTSSGYGDGGAIFSSNTELRISRTSFSRNSSRGAPTISGRGGAIHFESPSNGVISHIFNSRFVGNYARSYHYTYTSEGGAISVGSGALILANNLLLQNSSAGYTSYGGALHVGGAASVGVVNCTFVNNASALSTDTQSPYYGGAISVGDTASVSVVNAVFASNRAVYGADVYASATSTTSVTYSCMQTTGWGQGTQIPVGAIFMFIPNTADQSNYRLAPTSTCINAGSDAAVPSDALDLDGDGDLIEPVSLDLAEQTRFVGTVDCGAYEKP